MQICNQIRHHTFTHRHIRQELFEIQLLEDLVFDTRQKHVFIAMTNAMENAFEIYLMQKQSALISNASFNLNSYFDRQCKLDFIINKKEICRLTNVVNWEHISSIKLVFLHHQYHYPTAKFCESSLQCVLSVYTTI